MSLDNQQLLPRFVREMSQMHDLQRVEQVELDYLLECVKVKEKQLCLHTADETLSRYEQIYAIESQGLTSVERQRSLVAKLNTRITATKYNMIRELQDLTGHPVEIKELFASYLFTVGLVQNDLSDAFVMAVRKYLDMIKPAHLTYDLSLIRYEETYIQAGVAMINSTIMYLEVL